MILIADSGSTKCDWVVVDKGEKTYTKTIGFNPFFHSAEYIRNRILEDQVLSDMATRVTEIYYYGAGCSSPMRNSIVEDALTFCFPNAHNINVKEDILGAAIATSGDSSGIVCILGTGSNSCYYDGNNIDEEYPALGYILGDEGSGAYIGKKLLTKYLYKSLPSDLHEAFEGLGLTEQELIFKVYNQPHANVFLASLMKFMAPYEKHPYIQNLVYESFKEFAEVHIKCFSNYKDTPVSFLGSIAYFFQDQLNLVAKEFGFSIGMVLRQPIHRLSEYHQEKVA